MAYDLFNVLQISEGLWTRNSETYKSEATFPNYMQKFPHSSWESPQGRALLGEGKWETRQCKAFCWDKLSAQVWTDMIILRNMFESSSTFRKHLRLFMIKNYSYNNQGNNTRIKQTRGNRKRNIYLVIQVRIFTWPWSSQQLSRIKVVPLFSFVAEILLAEWVWENCQDPMAFCKHKNPDLMPRDKLYQKWSLRKVQAVKQTTLLWASWQPSQR